MKSYIKQQLPIWQCLPYWALLANGADEICSDELSSVKRGVWRVSVPYAHLPQVRISLQTGNPHLDPHHPASGSPTHFWLQYLEYPEWINAKITLDDLKGRAHILDCGCERCTSLVGRRFAFWTEWDFGESVNYAMTLADYKSSLIKRYGLTP